MFNDYQGKRQQMVDEQLRSRGIKDPRVLSAFMKVPRHLFLDEAFWPQGYDDHPLPISEKQTISQPYIVAVMTQALELKGTERVLEIGTGSGYQAAILAELAEQVYSVERIHGLAKRARKVLDTLKYNNIMIRIGDGTEGWKEFSPYHAIIVTASGPKAPEPLLAQLAIGGRLVIPVGDESYQDLIVFTKEGEDRYKEDNHGGVRFVKLIGEHGWKD